METRNGMCQAAIDIDRFRARQAQTPLRAYEVLSIGDRWSAGKQAVADAIMDAGWILTPFPAVPMRPPVAWDQVCAGHRSWHFHLHSWDGLAPVLAAFDHTREPRYLTFALETALDWIRQYPSLETDSPFAWYDMAVGVRGYRLGYLLDAAARMECVENHTIAALVESALLHAEALADDARFTPHSNHGFYFAAGQAALASRFPDLPGMSTSERQARQRLEELIHTQFTAEGVHREHSTDYHRMVYETFQGLLDAGLFQGEEFWEFSDRIQEALSWFVLPNGRLAMFGDTPHRLLIRPDVANLRNEALRFVASGGREGRPPAESVRAFPASGFIAIRNGWPAGPDDYSDWSYLAQTCAFHSRVHKHADDLSFVWYDRGRELLVDAGRYGYLDPAKPGSELWKQGFWYADPKRVYVESTAAHNTVEIDGKSFQRIGVTPFGSALLDWGEWAGIYYTQSRVRHWQSIDHRRILLFRPAEWLIVFDWLNDESGAAHRYTQRFHFAPELEAHVHESNLELALPGADEHLHVMSLLDAEPLTPIKGQSEPELLGWISRQDGELTPTWTGGFHATDVARHAFATLLVFGDEAPEPEQGSVGPDAEHATLRWKRGSTSHAVTFRRDAEAPFTLDYRIAVNRKDST